MSTRIVESGIFGLGRSECVIDGRTKENGIDSKSFIPVGLIVIGRRIVNLSVDVTDYGGRTVVEKSSVDSTGRWIRARQSTLEGEQFLCQVPSSLDSRPLSFFRRCHFEN